MLAELRLGHTFADGRRVVAIEHKGAGTRYKVARWSEDEGGVQGDVADLSRDEALKLAGEVS